VRINYENRDHWHPLLKELVKDVEDMLKAITGTEPTLTSDYRPGDKGVHGTIPLRGADVRCHDQHVGEKVAGKMNQQWEYDHARRWMVCVIFHDVGQGAHLHCQVHPNTRKK